MTNPIERKPFFRRIDFTYYYHSHGCITSSNKSYLIETNSRFFPVFCLFACILEAIAMEETTFVASVTTFRSAMSSECAISMQMIAATETAYALILN